MQALLRQLPHTNRRRLPRRRRRAGLVVADLLAGGFVTMSRPWLLAGGMLAGAALAVFYMVRVPDAVAPTEDAVAWVNGRPIARESYEKALAAVANDRKTGTLLDGDRERVLDRLIDQ